MTPAEAVAKSRREQGLPPVVTDEETLAAVAAIITPAVRQLASERPEARNK